MNQQQTLEPLSPDVINKIEHLLSELTLDEKLSMLHGDNVYDTKGVKRLGIPPFHFSDGPMGVRGEFDRQTCSYTFNTDDFATSFPCITALAATWDPQLAYETGNTLGREVRGRGKDVSLSPGINIQRSPLCGRNFEYMSEDPHLISKMCVPFIEGIQKNDVSACIKHFVANNQETRRMDVNVEIDERALHELYLPGFQAAIQEGHCMAVMGAYNQFRGEFCCQNTALMQDLLRSTWGFNGMVISDWGAVHDTKKALDAGIHFEMNVNNQYDDYYYANPLKERILSGEIKEDTIDDLIRRILEMMFHLKMMDPVHRSSGAYNTPENRKSVYQTARDSIVLLKNEKHLLPLAKDPNRTIAVIGENANRLHAFSGGSSEVRALYEITPLLGLKMYLGGNYQVNYAKGYSSDKEENQTHLFEEAIHLAKHSDLVLYVGGLNHDFDMESADRTDLKLPFEQDKLITALLHANPNTAIINMSGSPVEMRNWVDQAHTLVQYWYSGTEGGTALAEMLFGDVNPSGKLPVTFPKALEDTPTVRFGEFPGDDTVHYREGIYVGYRYYDTFNVEPEFCFGHGLSYTDFSYHDLRINVSENDPSGPIVNVTFSLTNTGSVAGAEVAQLYVSDSECTVERPKKELKQFAKIFLQPGETKEISMQLSKEAFCFYSVPDSDWKLESGDFLVQIGSSSRDLRLMQHITL